MLGYLNAPSPFTEDGYFITGDKVLQKGAYIKILGRESEIINVGGEKVYPQEVENIIMELPNILDFSVYGEINPIIGNIVCAVIYLKNKEDLKKLYLRVKKYCATKLKKFMVPVKIQISDDILHNQRYKKKRRFN